MEISGFHVAPAPEAIAETDGLGHQIAELSAHLEAATARLLDLIREFDVREGWNHGFRSCAHWLAWRVSMDLGAARERVRVARALGTLPRLSVAFARGELSYAKVRALTRVATPETEERLLAVGRAGSADHVERIVRGWRRVDQLAEVREESQRHKSRALQVYQDVDGMVVVRGRLTPEQGAVLMQALEAARETLYQRARGVGATPAVPDISEETPSMAQQQADALALIGAAAFPAAASDSARAITSVTGPAGGRRRCRTSRCCVGVITALCTRRATRSNDCPTGRSDSGGLTGGSCPTSRHYRRSRTIRSKLSRSTTRWRGFTWTSGRCVRQCCGSV